MGYDNSILGRRNDGKFRVEHDLSTRGKNMFDTWMVYDVGEGTNHPVETGIVGLDNALSAAARRNNPGPRYRVINHLNGDPFDDHMYWGVYDMWLPQWEGLPNDPLASYRDKKDAQNHAAKLNSG